MERFHLCLEDEAAPQRQSWEETQGLKARPPQCHSDQLSLEALRPDDTGSSPFPGLARPGKEQAQVGEPKEAGDAYEGSFPARSEVEVRKRSLGWAYQTATCIAQTLIQQHCGQTPAGKATMHEEDQSKFLGKMGNWNGTVLKCVNTG